MNELYIYSKKYSNTRTTYTYSLTKCILKTNKFDKDIEILSNKLIKQNEKTILIDSKEIPDGILRLFNLFKEYRYFVISDIKNQCQYMLQQSMLDKSQWYFGSVSKNFLNRVDRRQKTIITLK